MKKKEKIQKLLDILSQEHEFQQYGLCIMEQTCQEHYESKWCERNCKPQMDCRKCICHWILEEEDKEEEDI